LNVEISAGSRRYALGLLTLVYAFNQLDRLIFMLLVQPIKQDLGLSDGQMGFLTGFAFAAFYAVMGIPFALWADRKNRRKLIALSLIAWSIVTILCGYARNFIEVALTRFGVGVGEAGCNPPAHAILSDLYPPARRAMGLSIYGMGIPIGTLIGFTAAGWISQNYGWRTAFVAAGVPGILLGVLVYLTLPEPRRGASDPAAAPTEPMSFAKAIRFLRTRRSFIHLTIGGSLLVAAGSALNAFSSAFLIRTYHMSLTEVGLSMGLIAGCAGGIGMFLGGFAADRLGRNDPRWRLWVVSAAAVIAFPFAVGAYLTGDRSISLACLAVTFALCIYFYQGTSFAQAQSIAPIGMRGMAAAILLFTFGFLGIGTGPLIAGVLSDLLANVAGEQSLAYSLASIPLIFLWAAFHYYRAGIHLPGDIASAHQP
jgi:predicted MFS family arabinose efflux permease